MNKKSTYLALRDARSWRPASDATNVIACEHRPFSLPDCDETETAFVISRSEMTTISAGSRRHED